MFSAGNVMLIGHAATLDTCTRELTSNEKRSNIDMGFLMQQIPYASLVSVEFDNNSWNLIQPPCYPVTHTKNTRFDWKVLKS